MPHLDGQRLRTLAEIALDQGRVQNTVRPAESSYRIFRDLGDVLNITL